MAVLDIVKYGDPILRKVCAPVKDFSGLDRLIEDMFDTMYEAEGIGLAANQVGWDMNLFIIDITHTEETDEPMVFLNGEIQSGEGESSYEEGCLSIPEVTFEITRPEQIYFRYQTPDEEWHEASFGGLLARAIQHEMDHLTGKMIVDRVSKLTRIQYKKQLKDLEKQSRARLKQVMG
ncbi:MAG: peptide deformylase [Fidelibacterota bacterium]